MRERGEVAELVLGGRGESHSSWWSMASSGRPTRLFLCHVFACVLSLTAFGSYPCLEFINTPCYSIPSLFRLGTKTLIGTELREGQPD